MPSQLLSKIKKSRNPNNNNNKYGPMKNLRERRTLKQPTSEKQQNEIISAYRWFVKANLDTFAGGPSSEYVSYIARATKFHPYNIDAFQTQWFSNQVLFLFRQMAFRAYRDIILLNPNFVSHTTPTLDEIWFQAFTKAGLESKTFHDRITYAIKRRIAIRDAVETTVPQEKRSYAHTTAALGGAAWITGLTTTMSTIAATLINTAAIISPPEEQRGITRLVTTTQADQERYVEESSNQDILYTVLPIVTLTGGALCMLAAGLWCRWKHNRNGYFILPKPATSANQDPLSQPEPATSANQNPLSQPEPATSANQDPLSQPEPATSANQNLIQEGVAMLATGLWCQWKRSWNGGGNRIPLKPNTETPPNQDLRSRSWETTLNPQFRRGRGSAFYSAIPLEELSGHSPERLRQTI